jgi:hypothetical protein
MGGEGCTSHFTETGDDVDDACGDAGLLDEGGGVEGGEGCLFSAAGVRKRGIR